MCLALPGPPVRWMGLLLAGLKNYPTVAFFRWYIRRGDHAQDRQLLQTALLKEAVATFGRQIWHVFNRGYAGSRRLGELFEEQATFIIRWPKRYQLTDSKEKRNAWRIARGKAAQVRRRIWNAHQQQWRMAAALALPVTHDDFPQQPL